MKTIVLAGGKGARLGRLTQSVPKPMLRVGGQPLLWHIMRTYAHFGYDDFIVALGANGGVTKEYFHSQYGLSDCFTIDLASGSIEYHEPSARRSEPWRVTLADTGPDTLKGGRIKRVERFLESDTNLLTYGDGVADVDVRALVRFHQSHGRTLTITGVRPPSRFGEILADGDRVTEFSEKPQTSEGLINGGFMVFNRELMDRLTEDDDCDFERGVIDGMARDGEVMVYRHPGSWECVDTERDLAHLNALWDGGRAFWAPP